MYSSIYSSSLSSADDFLQGGFFLFITSPSNKTSIGMKSQYFLIKDFILAGSINSFSSSRRCNITSVPISFFSHASSVKLGDPSHDHLKALSLLTADFVIISTLSETIKLE